MAEINFRDYVEIVQDFPKDGIGFLDIQPLVKDSYARSKATEKLRNFSYERGANGVVCTESRGFILGTAIAGDGMALYLVRKKGKLPRPKSDPYIDPIEDEQTGPVIIELAEKGLLYPGDFEEWVKDEEARKNTFKVFVTENIVRVHYGLEYGEDCIEMSRGVMEREEDVVIVDDILATGGTASATTIATLLVGGEPVGYAFLAKVKGLSGEEMIRKVRDVPVKCLIE